MSAGVEQEDGQSRLLATFYFPPQRRYEFIEDPKYDERQRHDAQRPEHAFLKGVKAVRNDWNFIMHIARERQGERLAADYDIPAHHEHAKQNQQ